jgi:hypothetical protein
MPRLVIPVGLHHRTWFALQESYTHAPMRVAIAAWLALLGTASAVVFVVNGSRFNAVMAAVQLTLAGALVHDHFHDPNGG